MQQRHTFLFNLLDLKAPGGTDGVLVLTVDSKVPIERAATATLAAFKRALTVWVNTSPDGRAAWHKYQSFNIGDVAAQPVSDTMIDAMATEGINGFLLGRMNFDLAVDHDSPLVLTWDVTCQPPETP